MHSWGRCLRRFRDSRIMSLIRSMILTTFEFGFLFDAFLSSLIDLNEPRAPQLIYNVKKLMATKGFYNKRIKSHYAVWMWYSFDFTFEICIREKVVGDVCSTSQGWRRPKCRPKKISLILDQHQRAHIVFLRWLNFRIFPLPSDLLSLGRNQMLVYVGNTMREFNFCASHITC